MHIIITSCCNVHQVVCGAVLLLKASDANPATLGAARAALGGALAPAEVASDAQAIAHALLGQVETLRRKPDRAIGHLQQVGMQLILLT